MKSSRKYLDGPLSLAALVALMVIAGSAPALAQQPTAQASKLPVQRVGITGPPLTLSLQDAIAMALEKNRDIEIERANLDFSRGLLHRARGAFDPVFGAGPIYSSERIPVGSILAGGPSGALSQVSSGYNVQMDQYLPWGTRYQFLFDNLRSTTSNVFTQLSPQYSTGMFFSLTQPLLRNFEIDSPRRELRLRVKNVGISEAQLRQRVIEVITLVQQSYWDLVFARRDVEVKQEAVNLAIAQREMNRRQVEAGTLAQVEIVAAEAEVQRRREELLLAIERVTQAENSLKQLLAESRTNPIWSQEVLPSDPQPPIVQLPGTQEAVETALVNRPEIEQLRLQVEQNQIDLDFFRGQLRPQVDLNVTYGRRGLAGTVRSGDNPFTAQNQLLQNRVNELSTLAGLPPLPPPDPGQLPAFLSGGYGQSLSNIFDKDFHSVQVGLIFQLPLRNRAAEGDLARGLADARRLAAFRDRVEQLIEAEVRNALQGVETARQRVEAARAARVASKEKLDSETRLFATGETTNFLVLTRQNEYSAARGAEVRALTDLNKAIANLHRTLGITLQEHGLRLGDIP